MLKKLLALAAALLFFAPTLASAAVCPSPALTDFQKYKTCDASLSDPQCNRHISGTQVTQLQSFLADRYSLSTSDTVTGFFGRTTRTNVQKFQCEQNIICGGDESDGYGVVGGRTRAAIANICTSGDSISSSGSSSSSNDSIIASLLAQLRILQAQLAALTSGTTASTTTTTAFTTPICRLAVNPSSITTGQFSTLTWESQNATLGSISTIGSVALSGSKQVNPSITTTYTGTFSSDAGASAQCMTTLTVSAQATTTAPCNFNNGTILNGQSTTTYQSSSVAFGNQCASQTRTCSNGTLSGTYLYPACAVSAAASCPFNGSTIASGMSTTTYQAATVAFGSTCTPQTRTCTNGTLSGTYTYPMCTVAAAATPAPTCTLTPSPTSITSGQSSTLTISASNATGATINQGVGTISVPNGTKSVSPTAATTYTATVTGAGGTNTCTASVGISAASGGGTAGATGYDWAEKTTGTVWQWGTATLFGDGMHMAAIDINGMLNTSSNGGQTWTTYALPRNSNGTIVVNYATLAGSSDGMKLYLSSPYSPGVPEEPHAFYVSTDGGATWTKKNAPGVLWADIASSADGSKLVALDNGDGFVYTSSDSGTTWQKNSISAGQYLWYHIASSADGMKLYATTRRGDIYSSTDGGATWNKGKVADAMELNGIAVSADGSRVITVDYKKAVYTSTDSGATWTKHTIDSARYLTGAASSADGSVLAVSGDSTYVYLSKDGGATWTAQMTKSNVGQRGWSGVDVSSDGTRIIAYDSYRSLFTAVPGTSNDISYTETGSAWTKSLIPAERGFGAITSNADGQKLAALSRDYKVYTSVNGGGTWTLQASAPTYNNLSIVSSQDGSKLALSQYGGYIYTSIDGGVTWTQRGNTARGWVSHSLTMSDDGMKLAAIDADANGGLYTSTDGGATWTIAKQNDGYNWHVLYASSDGSKIFASTAYTSYISTDGGATWTSKPAQYMNSGFGSMTADGSKMFAASGSPDSRILVSSDDGTTWTNLRNASAIGLVNVAVLTSRDGRTLIAVEGNSGYAYISQDSGATWVRQTRAGAYMGLGAGLAFSADGKKVMMTDGNYPGIIIGDLTQSVTSATGASQLASALTSLLSLLQSMLHH